MPRLAALSLTLSLSLSSPAVAAAADLPPSGGRIVSDEGRTEILGRPLRAGDRIELPEGFIQVEEDGTEDGEVGSFTVVSADAFGASGPLAAEGEAPLATADLPEAPASPAVAAPPACRAERARYLAELWRMSGIEVSAPDAVLEGLESGEGAQTGYYWLALQTDPFRPLAWSSELRGRAEALARCVRGL